MDRVMRLLLLGRTAGASLEAALPGGVRMRWVVLAAALGIAARMVAAAQGHNYDFSSFWIVAGHVDAGDNVYASTHRYNYGPAWFLVLGALKQVADLFDDPFTAMRFLVAGLLTAVDVGIAVMLLRRFGPLTAILFLLHPVSILITGYHSQFDNLAIGIGLAGMLLLERADARGERGLGGIWLAGVAVLGLALVVKHILLVLPLWLAMRQATLARRVVVLLLPPILLVASFLPFLADGGAAGIMANVVGYRSLENPAFLNFLTPPIVQRNLPPMLLLGAALLIVGWLVRRRSPVEQLLVYSVTAVVFAPAMANQYLAIPAIATVVVLNVGYLAFIAVATLYLLADTSNLGLEWVAERLPDFLVRHQTGYLPFGVLVALLAIGLLITIVELRRASAGR